MILPARSLACGCSIGVSAAAVVKAYPVDRAVGSISPKPTAAAAAAARGLHHTSSLYIFVSSNRWVWATRDILHSGDGDRSCSAQSQTPEHFRPCRAFVWRVEFPSCSRHFEENRKLVVVRREVGVSLF
jgi:hypothetical protein